MIRFFAGHPTAANLVMVLMFVCGLVALPSVRRETFPDYSSAWVQVAIAYPGAGPERVEEAICGRIEDALDQLTDIEEIRCQALEGLGRANIEMAEGGDVDRFLADIKAEIDAIDDFPDQIEAPIIRQIERFDLVASVAVAGPMSEADLKTYAESLRHRLRAVNGIDQVELQGFAERQIRIALDPQALRRFGLSAREVADMVAAQSLELPSGTMETRDRDILVRYADERDAPLAFEDLVILAGDAGGEVRLGEIATITDRFERDENRVLLNGVRAALLQVSKTNSQDTLAVMDKIRAFVAEVQAEAPPGVQVTITRDVASIVEDRLNLLINNGLMGFALVFATLWLFFNLRLSFWVAMGLPASVAGTLFAMVMLGLSINMITMVGLLIALGLVMDDSIVIAENIASHLSQGKGPLAAAVDGTREVGLGVFSSFLTSAAMFAPLAFLAGDIGQVLRVVPIILILTLSVSLMEAFVVLPHHIASSARTSPPGAVRRRIEAAIEGVREGGVGRLADLAVRWRYLSFGLVIFAILLAVALVAGGGVKFRAFPELDGNVIEARLLLPQGTPLGRTEAVVAQVTGALARVDDALSPQQPDGKRLVRNTLVLFSTNKDTLETGPHVATVVVDLLAAEERVTRARDILNRWRDEAGTVPDVVALGFHQAQVGPAGIPIEIRLQGDDLSALARAADELVAWLARYDGVQDLMHDLRPGKPEVRIRLKEGAMAMGVTGEDIAAQLRTAFEGRTADEIQVGAESFEIDVQLDASGQDSLGDLDDFPITLSLGRQTPLSAVATVEAGRGVGQIARMNGVRTVTVRGDLDASRANLNEILAHTRAHFLPQLAARHPTVQLSLEGEAASQKETFQSMQKVFLVGLFAIFLILSLQFRSYLEPVIVMLAIPFAGAGVVLGHAAMGLDISMPSGMGAASLAGVAVNDSILLVMFVKANVAAGVDVVAAARQASRQRFRAVTLTSLTTIAGLLPILLEQNLQAQVLIPLVTSVVFGLAASTILVLVALPAAYALLHDLGLTSLARDGQRQAASVTAKT